MRAKTDRHARHKALLRDVAKLINQPADSLAVRLVALARLKMDALEVQLLAGDPTATVADITALQETFDKYVPKPTMSLDLHVVETAEIQQCPACQHKFDLATVRRTLAEAQHAARERDALEMASKKAVSTSAAAQSNAPAGTPAPANVVPLDAAQRSADLRAAALAAAPLKRHQAPVPYSPNVGPFASDGDNRSISQFMRDVDNAYRWRGP